MFGTDGIRGRINKGLLNPVNIARVSFAISLALKDLENPLKSEFKVVIAKDTRLGSDEIEGIISNVLAMQGIDIDLVGVSTTPMLSFYSRDYNLGIMITASHNPYYDNGLKLFHKGKKITQKFKSRIEYYLNSNSYDLDLLEFGDIRHLDRTSEYLNYLKSFHSQYNFSVVLDSANGAFSHHLGLLKEFGVEVFSINSEPTQININKGSGALFPEKVSKEVVRHYADFGIAFDGDGDRAVFIDERGNILPGEAILFLFSDYLSRKAGLKALVTTDYSNSALRPLLKNKGINLLISPVGDENVLQLMEREGVEFGGEESGHFIFKSYQDDSDGLFTALMLMKVMKETGKKLSELVSSYKPFPSRITNVNVSTKVPLKDLPNTSSLIASLKQNLHVGKIFLRYSGTESKLRLLVEAPTIKLVDEITLKIINQFKEEIKCRQ